MAEETKAPKAAAAQGSPLLEVTDLCKSFPLKYGVLDAVMRKERKHLTAVDHVSFSLNAGETLGLVGESGCGKSTLARTVINLYNPTGGKVVFAGVDFSQLSKHELRNSCKDIQMIFQDPYSSLNPRMTVRQVLREELLHHNMCTKDEVDARIIQLLELVGLSEDQADRLPSAFSGGQRQRIGIARALAVQPKLIIADEPVSALDVSIQAQIINLLCDLQEKLGLSILFISHDLRVVRYISDRVAVMYLGAMVETAPTDTLYTAPAHPYTKVLLAAAPSMEENKVDDKKAAVLGELPSPINLPSGCRFHPRCPYAAYENPPVHIVWAGGFFHGRVYVGTLCEGLARKPFVRRAKHRPKQGFTHKPARIARKMRRLRRNLPAQACVVLGASLGGIALLIAHVHKLGDNGDGELCRSLGTELEANGALDALPVELGATLGKHKAVHGVVLALAAHHAHVVRTLARAPHAALRVKHVAAGKDAHIVLGGALDVVNAGKARAGQQDALSGGETLLADVGRIVIHDRHTEAHMLGKRGRLGRSVGSAEQPHVNLVEERGAHPGEAGELVVVHAGAARDVLHLEQVARRVLAAGHDLLGVTAEEDERLAVGRTLLAVLLGDFVVHIGLGSLGVEHELEANPGKLTGLHGSDGTLEDRHVGHGDAVDERVEHGRRHVLLASKGLRLEAGKVLCGENGRLALLEGLDNGSERFLLHANILSLAKHTDAVQYSRFTRRDCCICNKESLCAIRRQQGRRMQRDV